jgi:hypothetical protein
VVSFTPWLLYPRERAPGTHWIGGWVDPRVSLDDMEERKSLTLPGLKFRPVDRPAHSQSLYRLRYPCSQKQIIGLTVTRPQVTTAKAKGKIITMLN